MASWCVNNSLSLNIKKTKEIILDFRKTGQYKHSPLSIGNEVVERVTDLKFLGVTVSEDLSLSTKTASVVGKTQQRLYYPRKLKSTKIPKQLMMNFYNCAISSVLYYGFLKWFSSCTKADQQALQRMVRTAWKIIGTTLPDMSTIYNTRCLRRVKNILCDQHITCSTCCLQVEGTGPYALEHPDWPIASIHRQWAC